MDKSVVLCYSREDTLLYESIYLTEAIKLEKTGRKADVSTDRTDIMALRI